MAVASCLTPSSLRRQRRSRTKTSLPLHLWRCKVWDFAKSRSVATTRHFGHIVFYSGKYPVGHEARSIPLSDASRTAGAAQHGQTWRSSEERERQRQDRE